MPPPRPDDAQPLFRRLPAGSHGMDPEKVAAHQRARLQGAMIAAVARHGYAKTTVAELVALAGVSRTAFYREFRNKETCFLETFDAIVEEGTASVSHAYRTPGDWQARLRIAFVAFCETVISQPGPAYLALVEVLSAGPAALVRRGQASEAFERMLRHAFEEAPQSAPISEMTARGIIGGVARLAYDRVGSGRPEDLRGLVDDVLAWTLSYYAPGVQSPEPPPRSGPAADDHPSPPLGSEPPPRPPRGIEERLALDHRERILRAIGAIVSHAGYPAVTIPTIAATAGISHETFYEQFPNKDAAFLATFDALAERASSVIITAYQQAGSWPEAMRAGIHAITNVVAEQRVFARLASSEFLAGGPAARARAIAVIDGLSALLQPGYAEARDRLVPPVATEAVMGALWTLIQHEVMHGRAADLPSQAPHLTYMALAPFIGAEAAAKLLQAPAS